MQAKVTLLSHTPMPEFAVASAAKLCYSASSIDDLRNNLTEEKAEEFVDMLASLGHESPLEHVTFTFGIENVSRTLLAQITRHRIASYSVQSQRYVKENDFSYVCPPEIENSSEAKVEFEKAMQECRQHYIRIAEILEKDHIENMVANGEDERSAKRKAEKAAIEDARFVLPNACATKMVCTFNARSLLNFFSQRCCTRAQWEIRSVANEMLRLCKEAAPHIFKMAGPACVRGKCSEGKMSCGRAAEIKKLYLKEE